MKAVIYARVSTEDQTTANQIDVLKEWAEQRGLELIKVYEETASAWKNGHQKQLAELMEDARKGKFKIVLVWALDRLTREGVAGLILLIRRFNEYGVKVISRQEDWTEYPNEFTPLFIAMMGFLAEFESRRRSERTKAGLARARAQGKKLGRPRKLIEE